MGKHGVPKAAFQKSKRPKPRVEMCAKEDGNQAKDGDPDKFCENCAFFRDKGKRSVGK